MEYNIFLVSVGRRKQRTDVLGSAVRATCMERTRTLPGDPMIVNTDLIIFQSGSLRV
jgi:hypothetical protein